jgi:hypothetical protein
MITSADRFPVATHAARLSPSGREVFARFAHNAPQGALSAFLRKQEGREVPEAAPRTWRR